jgi:hypothetical protein
MTALLFLVQDFYKPPQIKSITIERLQLGKASPTFPMLLAYKQSEPNQIRLDVEYAL